LHDYSGPVARATVNLSHTGLYVSLANDPGCIFLIPLKTHAAGASRPRQSGKVATEPEVTEVDIEPTAVQYTGDLPGTAAVLATVCHQPFMY
jgi:hypothetical protein